MQNDPNEDSDARPFNPLDRARERADEFRMHAELAAVFEGVRKFDAELRPRLDAGLARDVQRGIGKLEKVRSPETAVIPETAAADALAVLDFAESQDLSTNDYHIHRRPGEAMIIRWLAGDEVETFYTRLQAHFEAALNGSREDERQANEWKQDAKIQEYLKMLDTLVGVSLPERFQREAIRQNNALVLSTQTADEMNIAFLCDHVIGLPAVDVVGRGSAPPDEPRERDLAWFFKLFLLRGMSGGVEKMCFFTYLQKSDDSFDSDEE